MANNESQTDNVKDTNRQESNSLYPFKERSPLVIEDDMNMGIHEFPDSTLHSSLPHLVHKMNRNGQSPQSKFKEEKSDRAVDERELSPLKKDCIEAPEKKIEPGNLCTPSETAENKPTVNAILISPPNADSAAQLVSPGTEEPKGELALAVPTPKVPTRRESGSKASMLNSTKRDCDSGRGLIDNDSTPKLVKRNTRRTSVRRAGSIRHDNSLGSRASEGTNRAALPEWKLKMQAFLDSVWVMVFMTVWTVYALFGDDIRKLATNMYADPYFYGFTIASMSFFVIEIILSCICKPDYMFSFYFWMDLVSTLTMLLDIGWFYELLVGGTNYTSAGTQAKKVAQMARASRGARLGSKASKLVRVVRLIRMLRIVKLYKHTNTVLGKRTDSEGNEEDVFIQQMLDERAIENGSNEDVTMPEESKIGKVLSDVTTKKVIIIVLIVMLSVPLFSFNTYVTETKSFAMGLDFMATYDNNTGGIAFQQSYQSYLEYHRDLRTPLVYLSARNYTYDDPAVSDSDLRDDEKELATTADDSLSDYYGAIFDLRADTRLEAGLGIGQTVFVCIILVIGAFMFTKDANEMVIEPIEQMMGKVKKIATNPLNAAKEEESEAVALQRIAREGHETGCCQGKKSEHAETDLLQRTIVKTGSLLAIGLGEAGSRIIAQNIANNASGSSIDPLIPGTKVFAVFGFCDIRNFTDTTEILQVALVTNLPVGGSHGLRQRDRRHRPRPRQPLPRFSEQKRRRRLPVGVEVPRARCG